MSHNCKAVLFTCIDFRLVDSFRLWMKENSLIGDCDVVSVAGSAKEINGKGEASNFLLRQIDISVKLHNACQVILMNHSRCGAYNSVQKFSTKEDEIKVHKEDLEKAKKVINAKFPDVEVIKILADMQDNSGGKVDFINID